MTTETELFDETGAAFGAVFSDETGVRAVLKSPEGDIIGALTVGDGVKALALYHNGDVHSIIAVDRLTGTAKFVATE